MMETVGRIKRQWAQKGSVRRLTQTPKEGDRR